MTGNKIQNFAAQVKRTTNAKPQPKKEWSSAVKTSNGTYTVGMTRKQAEQTDSYKNFMGMDFKDIDKDGNGVLSQEEILEARVKAAKREQKAMVAGGGVLAVTGVATTLTSAALTPFTGVAALGVGSGLAQTSGGAYLMASGLKGDEVKQAETELAEYQKANKLDVKY